MVGMIANPLFLQRLCLHAWKETVVQKKLLKALANQPVIVLYVGPSLVVVSLFQQSEPASPDCAVGQHFTVHRLVSFLVQIDFSHLNLKK